MCATALDPRFKSLQDCTPDKKAMVYEKITEMAVDSYKPDEQEPTQANTKHAGKVRFRIHRDC